MHTKNTQGESRPFLNLYTLARFAFIASACFSVGTTTLYAQEFAALVTPPRVEARVEAGKTLRQIIEITHAGTQTSAYRIYTTDWTFAADGTVTFLEPLQPNSCRPWVALERTELVLAPQAKRRFRFEVSAPPDAPAGECRFAIMIEGRDVSVTMKDGVNFPMAGRIGVIVYASVGNGAPVLEVISSGSKLVEGRATAMLQVRNTGNAHGRLTGILAGKDSRGTAFELTPADVPILIGETRSIALLVQPEGKDNLPPTLSFPISVDGQLEWSTKKTPFKQTFAAVDTAPPAPVTAKPLAGLPAK